MLCHDPRAADAQRAPMGSERSGASFDVYRAARPPPACSSEGVRALEAKPIAIALRLVLHGVNAYTPSQ
jgi:hypothetical protein